MPSIFIKNARYLITMDERRKIIRDGAVAVGDGESGRGNILAVGKTEELSKMYGSSEIILDASGKVVMPGLIDTHNHTSSHLARGLADNVHLPTWTSERLWPFYSALTEDDAYISTLACCIEAIKFGTTCIIDPGGARNMDPVVKAFAESGIRGNVGLMVSDLDATDTVTTDTTNAAARRAEDFVKRFDHHADGRIRAWFSPARERAVSNALLKEIDALAEKYSTGITSHSSSTSESVIRHKEVFHGQMPVERFADAGILGPDLLIGGGYWWTNDEIALVKGNSVNVYHFPTASMHGGYGALAAGKQLEMLKRGINVSLASDQACESNFVDMFRVMYSVIAERDVKVDPTIARVEDIIEMATLRGAKAALREKEIGSLAPGKKADLLILDTSGPEWVPLHNVLSTIVHAATGHSVETVMIDGKIIVEDRVMKTVDEGRVLRSAEVTGEKLAEKANLKRFAKPLWEIV